MGRLRGFKIDLARLREHLADRYPTLHLFEGGATPVVRGSFSILHDGNELDRFSIEIDLLPLDAGKLPIVREVGGRIPRTADRHVNGDGSACVCLPADYFQKHPGAFDMGAFLEGPVRDYLIAQALVEQGDPWPHGEWSHREAGISEWFEGFFDSLTPDQVEAYVGVLAIKELKGHVPCPCGNGRRLRDCHAALVEILRTMVPAEKARELQQRRISAHRRARIARG